MSHRHPHQDTDWAADGTLLEREAELLSPALRQAAAWLGDRLATGGDHPEDGPTARHILDVGSGPGVMSCLLAHAFPEARVVAVDGTPELLARARDRATAQQVAERFTTQHAKLPDQFDELPEADLIWARDVVHHLGDQQAAVDALARRLRPGGLLALAEGGLPPRFLPRDIGIGRPGLRTRLDVAWEESFTRMRAELPGAVRAVDDWPAILATAGLVPSGTRTFLAEHQAPLGLAAREYLHARLSRLREFSDHLAGDDLATLDALLDREAPTGVLGRPDVFLLQATTVHTARATA